MYIAATKGLRHFINHTIFTLDKLSILNLV